jgi:hypothetical protein
VVIACALLLAVVAGCTTDQAGHGWNAINDADHDVIVSVSTDQELTIRLPAHVRAGLSWGWSTPGQGWGLTVYDASCRVLAKIPSTIARQTLYIGVDGAVDLSHDSEYTGPRKDGDRLVDMADLERATRP